MTGIGNDRELEELRRRLQEAEAALAAIRSGEADALAAHGAAGTRVHVPTAADAVYRRAVETMSEAVLEVRLDGVILFCTARFGEFVGMPLDQLGGMDLREFVAPDARTGLADLLGRCRDRQVRERVVLRGPNGVVTPVMLTGSALADGVDTSLCLVATDLTELENASLEVRRLSDATAALRVAGDTFRHLVERSPFGIYAVDADFRLSMVSDGAQKVFVNVRPLIDRDFEEVLRVLWPEPFVSEALGRFRHTLETGEPYHAASTVEQRADIGEAEAYDWKIERMTLPDGRPGVVCHFYDLSERQAYEDLLRTASQRLATALDASPVVVFHQDLDLRYTWIQNPALGQTANEIIGRTDGQLFEVSEDAERIETIKRDVLATGVARRETVRIQNSGVPHYFDLVVRPDRDADGTLLGVTSAAVDVTERRRADEVREAFIGILSHELRTPLTTILGSAELLGRPDAAHGPDASRDMLLDIAAEAGRLDRLVEDLLVLSRTEGGRLRVETEPVLVQRVVAAAVAAEERRYPRVTFVAEGSSRTPVAADPIYLEQILRNFLSNAGKYGAARGTVRVVAREEDAMVSVRVLDDGPGFEVADPERLFELFFREHAATQRAQGAGIGLYVTRALAEAMGGRVWAARRDGGGAEFGVAIPLLAADEVDRA